MRVVLVTEKNLPKNKKENKQKKSFFSVREKIKKKETTPGIEPVALAIEKVNSERIFVESAMCYHYTTLKFLMLKNCFYFELSLDYLQLKPRFDIQILTSNRLQKLRFVHSLQFVFLTTVRVLSSLQFNRPKLDCSVNGNDE